MADGASIPISNLHKGAQGELIASAWLLGLGYHVFRNISPCGPADLVIWNQETGETHLIDVKHAGEGTTYKRSDGSVVIPLKIEARRDVHRLIVVDGAVIGFLRAPGGATEFYWPLACPEVVVAFSPKANSYRETTSYTGLKRDQKAGWRRRAAGEIR